MISTILAQASFGGETMGTVFLFGSMILIMYFFMIRPQQKKQKDAKKFIDEIKKGDDVVTIGGLHGKVSSIEGDVVYIEIDRGVKAKIEKSSISMDFSKKSSPSK
jgi:preprotein translocase subunit YajC